MRCTGGGEPMLHPHMVDMIEFAKAQGARVWMNTNGSMFGPHAGVAQKLERVIAADIDLIEFSMDAGDAETYADRPAAAPRRTAAQSAEVVGRTPSDNVKAALELRKQLRARRRASWCRSSGRSRSKESSTRRSTSG